MIARSLIALAVVLSTACGAPPEDETPPPPPPVTLGDVWSCSFINASGMGWTHDVYRYTDGSTFASCEIIDGRNQYTNVVMYRSTMPGAPTGSCVLFADWDSTDTNGWWKFEFNGTGSTAKYSDPSSSFNGLTQTLSCAKY